MAAPKRRTQVEAIDDLAAEIRLHTEVIALSLPVAVLRHDDKNYADPDTKARVEEKNRRRAAVRAALGWEKA